MRAELCGKIVLCCPCGSEPTITKQPNGVYKICCPHCGHGYTGSAKECRADWNRWASNEAALVARKRAEERNKLFYAGMSDSAKNAKKRCNPFYGGAIAP